MSTIPGKMIQGKFKRSDDRKNSVVYRPADENAASLATSIYLNRDGLSVLNYPEHVWISIEHFDDQPTEPPNV